jgi:hypothetical protein
MTDSPNGGDLTTNQRNRNGHLRWVVGIVGIVTTLFLAQAGTVSYYSSAGDADLVDRHTALSSSVQSLTDRALQIAELLAVTSDSVAASRVNIDGQEVRLRTLELWRAESQGNRYTILDAQRDADRQSRTLTELDRQLSERIERLDTRLRELSDRIRPPSG